MTVLQPRRKSRALLATFLVGWLVTALAVLVISRSYSSDDSLLPWALSVSLLPAMPALFALSSGDSGPPLLTVGLGVIALVPVAVYVLGRRAKRRGRLLLCIVMAGWWLGFIAVYWSYLASGPHM